jgi:hypothetical protein
LACHDLDCAAALDGFPALGYGEEAIGVCLISFAEGPGSSRPFRCK